MEGVFITLCGSIKVSPLDVEDDSKSVLQGAQTRKFIMRWTSYGGVKSSQTLECIQVAARCNGDVAKDRLVVEQIT